MFQISENEYKILRSQIGTAKYNIKNKKSMKMLSKKYFFKDKYGIAIV